MPVTHAEGLHLSLRHDPNAVTGKVTEVHPSGSFDVYIPTSNTLSLCCPTRAGGFEPRRGQNVRCLLEFGTYGHVTAIEPMADTIGAAKVAFKAMPATVAKKRFN
ncbi:MAG: hypothetical protein R3D60_11990 [Paracoccaceae bacterium]